MPQVALRGFPSPSPESKLKRKSSWTLTDDGKGANGGASTLQELQDRLWRMRLACGAACGLAVCLPVLMVALLALATNLFELPLSRVALVSIAGGAGALMFLAVALPFACGWPCGMGNRKVRPTTPKEVIKLEEDMPVEDLLGN